MARFRDEWTDPTDTSNGINRGQQWSPYSDNLSVYDANKIVNNLIYLKNRIVDGTGTILTLGGETVASMEVDSIPQENGTNRLITSAGVANALKNFTPSEDNEYDDTELRELIDGKAALDASNLSDNNVTNWKEKLGVGGGLPLGTIIPATVLTDDANLHLLDGSSLSQTGIYSQFCTWLKERLAENSNNVPTCSIDIYSYEMRTYGQCGKFVINDTNSDLSSEGYTVFANSIKLPTITEFIASNNGGDAIGLAELDELKNHIHPIYTLGTGNSATNFSINSANIQSYAQAYQTTWLMPQSGGREGYGEETRPKNVRYPYYIVVADSVKTDIEVDIDNIANDLGNKVDKDLSNIADTIIKNKTLSLTPLWKGSITSAASLSLSQSFSSFNFLYILGRNSGNEYVSWIVDVNTFSVTTEAYPYDCGNNTYDVNRYVNLYKVGTERIVIKSIGYMTLLGVYGL